MFRYKNQYKWGLIIILLLIMSLSLGCEEPVRTGVEVEYQPNSTSDIYITKMWSMKGKVTYEGVPIKLVLIRDNNMLVFEDGAIIFPFFDENISLIHLGRINRISFKKDIFRTGFKEDVSWDNYWIIAVSYP